MKIEDQVCSLDLAKKLRELEVKQNSYFYWWKTNAGNRGEKWEISTYLPTRDTGADECYVAFTVAELGKMLPYNISSFRYPDGGWSCTRSSPSEMVTFTAENEADARAKMLVYLLESKLIMI